MHTLADLTSGTLKNATRLSLADNLTRFPVEIFELADSLETLDLSNNQLSDLPEDLSRLHQLKHLFLNNNWFESVPECLRDCPSLELISFKSNRLRHLSETALPKQTRWLILTDNHLTELPDSLGQHARLQKLMLAGNQLTALPDSLRNCSQLQLIRLSANQFPSLPSLLLGLPKLAWLAFAGNPFCSNAISSQTTSSQRPSFSLDDVLTHEVLGQGASGVIHRANWSNSSNTLSEIHPQIAVKLFKGNVTSDGYPHEELHANLHISQHPNLVEVLAHVTDSEQSGIVMSLIPEHYFNLGLPPDLHTCTRDRFIEGLTLSLDDIAKIALSMADALLHLHAHHICHGDVYAHNILIDAEANVLFGDFGASSNFSGLTPVEQQAVQQMEVRAYGWLLEDLISLCETPVSNLDLLNELKSIQLLCFENQVGRFTKILTRLEQHIKPFTKA